MRAHAQTSASWLTAAAALAEEVELGVLVALEVRGGTREGVLHHDVDLPALTMERGKRLLVDDDDDEGPHIFLTKLQERRTHLGLTLPLEQEMEPSRTSPLLMAMTWSV